MTKPHLLTVIAKTKTTSTVYNDLVIVQTSSTSNQKEVVRADGGETTVSEGGVVDHRDLDFLVYFKGHGELVVCRGDSGSGEVRAFGSGWGPSAGPGSQGINITPCEQCRDVTRHQKINIRIFVEYPWIFIFIPRQLTQPRPSESEEGGPGEPGGRSPGGDPARGVGRLARGRRQAGRPR